MARPPWFSVKRWRGETGLCFSWNFQKEVTNVLKHGVTFDEACTAFGDPHSITISDPTPEQDEARFLLIGRSRRDRLLVVVHAEWDEEEIRLISARPASRGERRYYEEEAG